MTVLSLISRNFHAMLRTVSKTWENANLIMLWLTAAVAEHLSI